MLTRATFFHPWSFMTKNAQGEEIKSSLKKQEKTVILAVFFILSATLILLPLAIISFYMLSYLFRQKNMKELKQQEKEIELSYQESPLFLELLNYIKGEDFLENLSSLCSNQIETYEKGSLLLERLLNLDDNSELVIIKLNQSKMSIENTPILKPLDDNAYTSLISNIAYILNDKIKNNFSCLLKSAENPPIKVTIKKIEVIDIEKPHYIQITLEYNEVKTSK